mmetsp:Transcript_9049/g.37025  ORF Transcript_9049/g.37025 Transcript_9049/m.37025 type:complete len:232 (-) Transcript_9049:977-1672(-)
MHATPIQTREVDAGYLPSALLLPPTPMRSSASASPLPSSPPSAMVSASARPAVSPSTPSDTARLPVIITIPPTTRGATSPKSFAVAWQSPLDAPPMRPQAETRPPAVARTGVGNTSEVSAAMAFQPPTVRPLKMTPAATDHAAVCGAKPTSTAEMPPSPIVHIKVRFRPAQSTSHMDARLPGKLAAATNAASTYTALGRCPSAAGLSPPGTIGGGGAAVAPPSCLAKSVGK